MIRGGPDHSRNFILPPQSLGAHVGSCGGLCTHSCPGDSCGGRSMGCWGHKVNGPRTDLDTQCEAGKGVERAISRFLARTPGRGGTVRSGSGRWG